MTAYTEQPPYQLDATVARSPHVPTLRARPQSRCAHCRYSGTNPRVPAPWAAKAKARRPCMAARHDGIPRDVCLVVQAFFPTVRSRGHGTRALAARPAGLTRSGLGAIITNADDFLYTNVPCTAPQPTSTICAICAVISCGRRVAVLRGGETWTSHVERMCKRGTCGRYQLDAGWHRHLGCHGHGPRRAAAGPLGPSSGREPTIDPRAASHVPRKLSSDVPQCRHPCAQQSALTLQQISKRNARAPICSAC
jgi:hypothetical protein